jgi:hypothetical protein
VAPDQDKTVEQIITCHIDKTKSGSDRKWLLIELYCLVMPTLLYFTIETLRFYASLTKKT